MEFGGIKIRPVNQEEASSIPWLNIKREKQGEPKTPNPLVDEVLAAIDSSKTGIACIELGDLGGTRVADELIHRLKKAALKERKEKLETRIVSEEMANTNIQVKKYRGYYDRDKVIYIRRFPVKRDY